MIIRITKDIKVAHTFYTIEHKKMVSVNAHRYFNRLISYTNCKQQNTVSGNLQTQSMKSVGSQTSQKLNNTFSSNKVSSHALNPEYNFAHHNYSYNIIRYHKPAVQRNLN